MHVNTKVIKNNIDKKGYSYFNLKDIKNVNELKDLGRKFGKLRNMKSFNTHHKSKFV